MAGYDLEFKLGADVTGVKKGLKDTSRSFNKVSRQLNQNERTWQSWSIRSVAATVALGMAISAVARKTVEYADAFQSITNKLKIATDGTEELTQATERMFAMANENRSSIETTVDLYTKLERSTRELGFSSEKLADITDIIGKAFVVGGATSKEMDGAIRQLGQSLSLGALRGEEFNSVAEQAPVIMEAMKAATGKNAGELRKLAATGAITSKILIGSLDAYSDKIRGDFAKTQATYGGKMEIARNKAIEFVGANEQIKSIVSDAGDAIVYLSENLETLIDVGKSAVAVYGATLVNAMGKAVWAKSAAVIAANTLSAAELKAMELEVASMKVTTRGTAIQVAQTREKVRAAVVTLRKKKGTDKETASVVKLTAAIHAHRIAQGKATAAKVISTTAEKSLTVANNLSTATIWRQNTALAAKNILMGNWVTIAAVAAYAAYEFIDWETQVEKKANLAAEALNKQVQAVSKLNKEEVDLGVTQSLDANTQLTSELQKQQKVVDDLKKEYAKKGSVLNEEYEKELQKLNAIKQAQKASASTYEIYKNRQTALEQKAALQRKTIYDMDASAQLKAHEKTIAAYEKKSRTEIEVAEDTRDKAIAAYAAVAAKQIESVQASEKSEAEKAARILEINTKLGEDLVAAEALSSEQVIDIKRKLEKQKEALRKQSPEFKAQERVDKLKESLLSEEEAEKASYKKRYDQFVADAALTGMATEEKNKTLRKMEAKHKAAMDEIQGKNTFIADLEQEVMSEIELERFRLAEKLAALQEHMVAKGETLATHQELIESLVLGSEARITKIEKDESEKRRRQAHRETMDRINYAQNMANSVLAIGEAFGGKSKKQQKRMRRAAVVIDTAAGVMKAFGTATDIYSAIALSAMVVARGKKSLDAINSERSVSGGSVSVPTAKTPTRAGGQQGNQATSPRTISINMEGSALFSADQVRELIEQINEQVGDGVALSTGG